MLIQKLKLLFCGFMLMAFLAGTQLAAKNSARRTYSLAEFNAPADTGANAQSTSPSSTRKRKILKITEFKLPPTGNASPQRIAAGPDGAMWFTESNSNKIGRITTRGKI